MNRFFLFSFPPGLDNPYDTANRKLIHSIGGTAAVIQCFTNEELCHNDHVVYKALCALWNICAGSEELSGEHKTYAVQHAGKPVLTAMIRLLPKSGVQEKACGLLGNLTFGCASRRLQLVKMGMVSWVTQSLQTHLQGTLYCYVTNPAILLFFFFSLNIIYIFGLICCLFSEENLQQYGLECLFNISLDVANLQALKPAIPHVVAALTLCSGKEHVQESVLGLLVNAASVLGPLYPDLNPMAALPRLLKLHRRAVIVHERVFMFLAHLTLAAEGLNRFVTSIDGMKLAGKTMKSFEDSARVQRGVCGCLTNVISGAAPQHDIVAQFIQKGVLDCVLNIFLRFNDAPNVHWEAIRVLSSAFKISDASAMLTSHLLLRDDIVQPIVRAVIAQKTTADVRTVCAGMLAALVNLLESDNSLLRDMVVAGAIEYLIGPNEPQQAVADGNDSHRQALIILSAFEQHAPSYCKCGGCDLANSPLDPSDETIEFHVCPICQVQAYCSTECREEHFHIHQLTCVPKVASTSSPAPPPK
jgi:hypothetical protein